MSRSASARAAPDSDGHRPRRLRRVADDRPGGGAATPPDHPPLHRGEVLRLVDEHVRVAVVLDPVGRRRPAAGAGVLAVGGGGHLLQGGVDRAERVLVEVELHLAGDRRVAEQVAQLVEQRHVVDGEVVAPRLRQQPHRLVVEHAVGDPGEQLGVAQPAEHGRGVEHRPPRRARTRGTRRRCAARRRSPPWCARAPARRGPGATARRSASRRPWWSSGCAGPSRAAGDGSRTSSRGPRWSTSSR